MIAEFTNNPYDVRSVAWIVTADDLLDVDPEDAGAPPEDVLDGIIDTRFRSVEVLLRRRIMREYHNCPSPNITIMYGGWADSGSAPMSPRAETISGAIYEPFFDELNQWTAYACECATEFFPLHAEGSQS